MSKIQFEEGGGIPFVESLDYITFFTNWTYSL